MLKVHGRYDSINVQKVLLTLEELGVEYQLIPTGVLGSEKFERASKILNPNQTVPILQFVCS